LKNSEDKRATGRTFAPVAGPSFEAGNAIRCIAIEGVLLECIEGGRLIFFQERRCYEKRNRLACCPEVPLRFVVANNQVKNILSRERITIKTPDTWKRWKAVPGTN
jgi:hypothetical protein